MCLTSKDRKRRRESQSADQWTTWTEADQWYGEEIQDLQYSIETERQQNVDLRSTIQNERDANQDLRSTIQQMREQLSSATQVNQSQQQVISQLEKWNGDLQATVGQLYQRYTQQGVQPQPQQQPLQYQLSQHAQQQYDQQQAAMQPPNVRQSGAHSSAPPFYTTRSGIYAAIHEDKENNRDIKKELSEIQSKLSKDRAAMVKQVNFLNLLQPGNHW